MSSDVTTITDHPTLPCPPPGCERPTNDQIQRAFRIPSMSQRAALALLTFGKADSFPATTNHRTTIGVQIAEETR